MEQPLSYHDVNAIKLDRILYEYKYARNMTNELIHGSIPDSLKAV